MFLTPVLVPNKRPRNLWRIPVCSQLARMLIPEQKELNNLEFDPMQKFGI